MSEPQGRLAQMWAERKDEIIPMGEEAYRQESAKSVAYITNRRAVDPHFKLSMTLRARVRAVLKAQNAQRNGRFLDLLGCTIAEAYHHLAKQFDEHMTWENHGSYWHIDHIKPCAMFDLTCEDQQRECFHYTNLQPLEATANRKKWAHYSES